MKNEKRLIDANALMAQLEERQAFLVKEWGYRDHYARGFVEAVDKVYDAPTVDAVEVVHGRWLNRGKHDWCCSACKIGVPYSYTGHKHCHNCGAKMNRGEET